MVEFLPEKVVALSGVSEGGLDPALELRPAGGIASEELVRRVVALELVLLAEDEHPVGPAVVEAPAVRCCVVYFGVTGLEEAGGVDRLQGICALASLLAIEPPLEEVVTVGVAGERLAELLLQRLRFNAILVLRILDLLAVFPAPAHITSKLDVYAIGRAITPDQGIDDLARLAESAANDRVLDVVGDQRQLVELLAGCEVGVVVTRCRAGFASRPCPLRDEG